MTLAATSERAAKSADNRIVTNAMSRLPKGVKQRWVRKYRGDAETAFRMLLTGEANACAHCGGLRPNVQAVRLYAEMADAVGPAISVNATFIDRLGVRDEGELRGLVESGRRLQSLEDSGISLEAQRDDAVEVLRLILRDRPEWLPGIVARLSSGASVEYGAGTANGGGYGSAVESATNGHTAPSETPSRANGNGSCNPESGEEAPDPA